MYYISYLAGVIKSENVLETEKLLGGVQMHLAGKRNTPAGLPTPPQNHHSHKNDLKINAHTHIVQQTGER